MGGLPPQPKDIYLVSVPSLRTWNVKVAPAGTCWTQAPASSAPGPSAPAPSGFAFKLPPHDGAAVTMAVSATLIPARERRRGRERSGRLMGVLRPATVPPG